MNPAGGFQRVVVRGSIALDSLLVTSRSRADETDWCMVVGRADGSLSEVALPNRTLYLSPHYKPKTEIDHR